MRTLRALYEVTTKSPYAIWIGAGAGLVIGLLIG